MLMTAQYLVWLRTGLAVLMLAVSAIVPAAPLDIDGDGSVSPATDGQLILRHLFGFSGTSLVTGAVGPDAVRDTATIEDYLVGLHQSLDVDGDGKSDALTDGVLILRHLLGRTGSELTADAVSPGATLDAAAIAARIDGIATPPGQAPSRVSLVQANSLAADSIQLDWLPTFDNDTPGSRIVYVLHAAETANFVPDANTARAETIDNATGIIVGLVPATTYFVKVEARDGFGHSSWSNELRVTTAATNPQATAAPRQTLDDNNASEQNVEPDRIEYRLGQGAAPPAVGDILVSAEGGGFLRRTTAVQRNGDQIGVDTEPAALNELYGSLSLATEIALVDLPDSSGAQSRSVGRGVIFQRSADTVRATWPDSGLTIVQQRPAAPSPRAAQPTPQASATATACDGLIGERKSRWDHPLEVTYPERACVEPGSTLNIDISAEIESGSEGQYQITQLLFKGLKHPRFGMAPDNFGAEWTPPNPGSDTRGKGTLSWTPNKGQVDGALRPFTAQFVAIAKERDGHCTGALGLWCQTKTIGFETDIAVSWGDFPGPSKQTIAEASGGLALSGTTLLDFQPRIRTEAKIGMGGLGYARASIEGPISFQTEINLEAFGAASFETTRRLIDKRFSKIYWAGTVPIVINGRFKLDVQFKANADATLDLTQTLDIGYGMEAGLEYSAGRWRVLQEAEPWHRYEISGEADGHGYVELRFVPDLELAFYDAITGRLIVEPYLYGEAAVEGHFSDRIDAQMCTDTDYRFTKLEFGGGLDGKLRAGLEVFDTSIVGYPSSNPNDLYEFTLIERKPIVGLPKLIPKVVGQSRTELSNETCCGGGACCQSAGPFCNSIALTVDIEDDPLNPFEEESAVWDTTMRCEAIDPGYDVGCWWYIGGEITPGWCQTGSWMPRGESRRDVWFSGGHYTEYRDASPITREYTLRFSGHSALGSFIRQYEEIQIQAQDCAISGDPSCDPLMSGPTRPVCPLNPLP